MEQHSWSGRKQKNVSYCWDCCYCVKTCCTEHNEKAQIASSMYWLSKVYDRKCKHIYKLLWQCAGTIKYARHVEVVTLSDMFLIVCSKWLVFSLCCISPVLAANVIKGCQVTIGSDQGTATAIEQMGAKHVNKNVTVSFLLDLWSPQHREDCYCVNAPSEYPCHM